MKKKLFIFCLLYTTILMLQSMSAFAEPISKNMGSIAGTSNTLNEYSASEKREAILLSESKDAHFLGQYQTASQGYTNIINMENISQATKLKADAYLALSRNDMPLSVVQKYTEDYSRQANEARVDYLKNKYKYESITEYDSIGDFLNASKASYFYTHGILKMDKEGLPMVQYGDVFYYNPITLAQFTLTMHGRYIKNESDESRSLAIKACNKLIELQSNSGAFRFSFPYQHYLNASAYSPGWVSSMAQGQAISAFLRVYAITKDSKYISAANLSFDFMKTRVAEGGVLDSLNYLNRLTGKPEKDSFFYQEYITEHRSYTLNGYIYTMLGLYDLSNSDSAEASTAKWYFSLCEESLREILKYYDIGTFTCYDLGYITKVEQTPIFNTSYHSIHIELMDTMYSITKNPLYRYYGSMWKSYVEPVIGIE